MTATRAFLWILTLMAVASFDGAQRAIVALARPESVGAGAAQPHAGDEVLPPAARALAGMVRARGLGAYRLSPRLAADELIAQRATEAAWPAAPRADARQVFFAPDEPLPAGCGAAERGAEVVLADCD